VNPSFLKGLERRSLRMGESRLDAAFGKRPVPAAGPHEQEINLTRSHPVTNRSYLFTLSQFADMRQPKYFC
jgi:hypothetical protein